MKYIIDIEANGLLLDVTKIWTVKAKPLDSSEFFTIKSAQQLYSFIEDATELIGHNIYGYDLPVLEKIWGVDYGHNQVFGKKIPIWDTLLMSQYAEPDLFGGHSLAEWGKRLGMNKIDYRDALMQVGALDKVSPRGAEFTMYHPLMETYCERDTEVCELVYKRLIDRI